MSWGVTLEVDSELKPVHLAMLVNLIEGVNDCYISDSKNKSKRPNRPSPNPPAKLPKSF